MELLRGAGDTAVKAMHCILLLQKFNKRKEWIPEDWRKSKIFPIYNRKGVHKSAKITEALAYSRAF